MRRAVLAFAIVIATVRADVSPIDLTVRPASSVPTDPAPLLVVLHGNHESAKERAKSWRSAIERQGWRLLALDCPRHLGCDEVGRWYTWNGDPRWIRDQVRAFADRETVDTSRIYLAGWSGGATYIGKRLPQWTSIFAGIVIHGGGVPPRTGDCPDRLLPVYFLVGDENPGHGGAQRLRSYVEDCRQPHIWDLLPGANHAKEDAALTPEKADAILRWLATQRHVDAWS